MPDDHSEVEPLLPIPNRTVKRLSADDSADSRVKVGHRQAFIPKAPGQQWQGAFFMAVMWVHGMEQKLALGCVTELGAVDAMRTASALLLEPASLSPDRLAAALRSAASAAADDADVFLQYSVAESWALEEGIVKTGSFSIDRGFGLRVVSGEKTAFAYADDISASALAEAAREVRSAAMSGAGARFKLQAPASPQVRRTLYADINPIATLGSADKVVLLQKIEKLARARDERIVRVMLELTGSYDVILVARLDGLLAADVRPLVRLSISVMAEKDGRREMGASGGGGRFGLDYFSDEVIQYYVDEAVRAALDNLEARPAPAGEMDVVLGSGWPGVLLHEAVGHGLEGDFNRKGASAFSGCIGQRVAAPGVTVLDDGAIAGRRGSLNVDDEGQATRCNVLIEDGILRGYLHDRMNARLMQCAPTGNGRRESYAHIPLPRMTNTYMLPGDKAPEEIIASLERGIYATNFGGGQVDITNGKFVFSASSAYWVENGKIQYPVKGATIIGSGPQSLKKMTLIGNDLRLDSGIGVCGKEGQSVPVGVGMPTVRINAMTVGGTA